MSDGQVGLSFDTRRSSGNQPCAESAWYRQKLDPQVHRRDVLAGKYEVDRVLGSGGMGMVVRAKHIQLGEMVAIKFLLPDFGTVDRVARFEREARAAAKLKGDHVT